MGLIPLDGATLGTVVTSLEMTARPAAAAPVRSALRLERWNPVDRTRYLDLFRAVGAPWLWCGRLMMSDDRLGATLAAPSTEVHAATRRDGTPVGLLDLDFSVPATCELVYFGLIAEMTGRGHGGWLMAHALRLAWRPGVERVWVPTCTHDHPGALGFYRRQGFRVFARALETLPDPRVTGLLPRDSAPHVPLLG